MLITKDFVFLHVPKTGGSFVRELCRRHLSPVHEYFDHRGYNRVPPEFADLPGICFVRNPWDWYVSWYHFLHAHDPAEIQGFLFDEFLDGGSSSFAEAITKACTLRSPTSNARSPVWLDFMRDRDCDYFTALHDIMRSDSPRVEVGKFESLRSDWIDFIDRHGIPVTDAFREDVMTSKPVYPKLGSPDRPSYQSHYDEELRDLVAAHCPLVARYGYSFT